MICGANQWTGFYMMSASVMKGLRLSFILIELLPLAKPLSQILRQSYIRDQTDKYF